MPARRILAVAVATSAVVLAAPAAWAYFGLHVAAPVSATAGVLDKPGALDVTLEPGTPSGLRARISWTAPDADPGDDTKSNDDAATPTGSWPPGRAGPTPGRRWRRAAWRRRCRRRRSAVHTGRRPAGGRDTVAYRYRARSWRKPTGNPIPSPPGSSPIAPDDARSAARPDRPAVCLTGRAGAVGSADCPGPGKATARCGRRWPAARTPTCRRPPAASGDGLRRAMHGADVECATACGTTPGGARIVLDAAVRRRRRAGVRRRPREMSRWPAVAAGAGRPAEGPALGRRRWVTWTSRRRSATRRRARPGCGLGVPPAGTDSARCGCPDAALHALQLPTRHRRCPRRCRCRWTTAFRRRRAGQPGAARLDRRRHQLVAPVVTDPPRAAWRCCR